MLREAHDLARLAGSELGEGEETLVLRLLELGRDRPAVRAAVGLSQALVHPLDHLVGERVAHLVRVDVRPEARETPSMSATRDAIALSPAGRYSPIGKARK